MNRRDAVSLLATAISPGVGTWADLGAGDGTFTRALAELLAPGARIYAIDRDARSLSWAEPPVIPVAADFTEVFSLPGLGDTLLDGMLFANSLHFVRDADVVLAALASLVKPGGSIVVIEYDRRPASRWVPYPVSFERLAVIAKAAGLSAPKITAMRPSLFAGNLYIAKAHR
jgi:ubiquinone/menaquinone biosynthesis C-methylase UbiE